MVGWAEMLAALKILVRSFVRQGQDITAKLKRLWAYEIKNREGGNKRSVFVFIIFVLNFLTLLRSPVDNTNRDAKRTRGLEALPGTSDFKEHVRAVTVGHHLYRHYLYHHYLNLVKIIMILLSRS